MPTIVDRMICVPDAASLAAMRGARAGHRAGGPAAPPAPTCGARSSWSPRWWRPGGTGSVVTLLCDGGERYAHTYYSDDWVAAQGLDLAPHAGDAAAIRRDGGVAGRPG